MARAGTGRVAVGVTLALLVGGFVVLVARQLAGDSETGGPGGDGRGVARGLVTAVSATEVRVRVGSGEELVFVNADPAVTVEHLEEHRRDRLPVVVTWSGGPGGRRVATEIADG